MLSVPVKFSTIALHDWLQKETGPALTPVQLQAQKRFDEVRVALQNLADASRMLVDASQKEIEKRNMKVYNRARALNKLANMFIERLKKLEIPEKVSFDSLSTFSSEAQKTMVVTDLDIKNWFPHISPFFIIDRRKFQPVFDKSKNVVNQLNDFVNKEYVKTKTQEKTFQLIAEVQNLEAQLNEVSAQKASLIKDHMSVEKEIAATAQQMSGLKGKTVLDQLSQVEAEQETLNNELKNVMRHFQKPFIKMQALATSGGGGGITPDELHKITQYLDNPFEALATEQNGIPALKEILSKLTGFMAEDKLKLKPDKQRKAEQSVEDILKRDILSSYRAKCIEAASRKKQLVSSPELEDARSSLLRFQEELNKLRIRRENLGTDEALKATAANELIEKIRIHKKTIEANVLSFLGKQIQII